MPIDVRRYRPTDAEPTYEVFRTAIRETASAFYSPAQIDAWCPVSHDATAWARRREASWTLVAEVDGHVVGFSDLTEGGEVDMLFVHPDAGGRGVAQALLTRVLAEARRRGVDRVTTRASRVARPVFERLGFTVAEANDANMIRGVVVPNYVMVVDLG